MRTILYRSSAIALTAAVLAAGPVWAEKTLTIGMTAADIPRTSGQPDQGFEGNRFTGIPMYDALTHWDLSSETKASGIVPGLATAWEVNPDDTTKWTFTLREGVTFHDGSPFNADAVVWNVQKVLDEAAPHFAPDQVGATKSRMPTLASARAIDELTVELTTTQPDSFLPLNMTMLFMASPTHWQALYDAVDAAITDPKERAAAAWTAFAFDPSGTGPFEGDLFVPRERFEMVKNQNYWDPARTPTIDRVVLVPLPDANARTAALLSGQVDWIEAPAPDAIPRIQSEGNVIYGATHLAHPSGGVILLAGLVYLIGCFGVTVVFNVPMNEALAGMDLTQDATRAYWTGTYLPRWTFWNTVRTLACGVSAALLLFGLLSMTQAQATALHVVAR